MKLSISPYFRSGREGALLRFSFDEGFGYADLHPWPSLGDAPLHLHLKEKSALFQLSLKAAQIDARFRREGRSLFEGLEIPKSHLLVDALEELAQAKEEGFTTVKWKISPKSSIEPFLVEAERLSLKVRLDANSSFQEGEFRELLARSYPWHVLEFVEDPYPKAPSWNSLSVPVASDWEESPFGKFQVVKPLQRAYKLDERETIVTGSLGHPIGDAFAAYVAATAGSKNRCHGLLGFRSSPFTSFNEELSSKGPSFTPPSGTGIGFDALLDKIEWSLYDGAE